MRNSQERHSLHTMFGTNVTTKIVINKKYCQNLGRRALAGSIGIYHIPNIFRSHYKVSEYDGKERVYVNVMQVKGFLLDIFMRSERGQADQVALDVGYRAILEGERQLEELNTDLEYVRNL